MAALCLVLATASAQAQPSDPAQRLGKDWALDCEQQDLRIQCHYRPLQAGIQVDLAAELEDLVLPIEAHQAYPSGDAVSAVLFLVDTSDPRRAAMVGKAAEQIQTLFQNAGAHYRLGVASFDKGVSVLAPLGSDAAALRQAAQSLQAQGQVTELFRSTLQAIELLADYNAQRKALFLFSDGLAEDTAYTLEEVIEAAQLEKVTIFGLGYARSSALSVGLQSLRRLSEGSGGLYWEADATAGYRLPREAFQLPFQVLDGGGSFQIDLLPAVEAGHGGLALISVRATPGQDRDLFRIPAALPELETQPPEQAPIPVLPAAAPPPEPSTNLVSLLLAGSLVILAFALLFVLRARRTHPSAAELLSDRGSSKPYAFLEAQGETLTVHPITRLPWRIGRSENNDMTVTDVSISRHHAQILHDQSGNFRILDLNSKNGVLVNGKKIAEEFLEEGNQVELGDVIFRFSLSDPELQESEDETVFLETRTPQDPDLTSL